MSATAKAKSDEQPQANGPRAIALPRCGRTELIKLSEAGDKIVIWSHTSFRDAATIATPGYFWLQADLVARNDRIIVTANEMSVRRVYGTLVVLAINRAANEVPVAWIIGPIEVEAPPLSPLEMLALRPGCSREDILTAYRARSKLLHPDYGGNTADFQALTRARDEALKMFDL